MTLKERVLTKPGYKYLLLIGIVIGLIQILNYLDKQEINKIKNDPNISVECNIKGKGWVTIDKSKITSIGDDGTFIFTNGYAKSCIVINYNN
jgi:hypothetical protein